MSTIYSNIGNRKRIPNVKQITPQSMPIPHREKEMTKNNAGGVVFKLDKWNFLDRFLILGSEGGSYYVKERDLTVESALNVIKCIKEDGKKTVDRIVQISSSGRAPKNSPAIFALALCMVPEFADVQTRRYATNKLPKVARIGTHVLEFANVLQSLRGWGKLGKKAISQWFESKTAEELGIHAVKYTQRNGFALKDLMRLSHPFAQWDEQAAVMQYIAHPEDLDGNTINVAPRPRMKKVDWKWVETEPRRNTLVKVPDIIFASAELKKLSGNKNLKNAIKLISTYNLPREVVPTEYLNYPEIWEVLLPHMGLTAMIRNIGKMSAIEVLKPLNQNTKFVCESLVNIEKIRKAKVHPIQFLLANRTYSYGHGIKGSLTWNVIPQILDALEDGFYKSFDQIEPTGKNFYHGIDVSGSMTWSQSMINGVLSCAEAAAAMAMVTVKTEPYSYTAGFSGEMKNLNIGKNDTLNDVITKTKNAHGGITDCSLPMLDAIKKKLDVDCFMIYTDNETWSGMHPSQALREYRQKSGRDAKLIVLGMVSNGFTIADPLDPGMLDIVGFDSSVPQIINSFLK